MNVKTCRLYLFIMWLRCRGTRIDTFIWIDLQYIRSQKHTRKKRVESLRVLQRNLQCGAVRIAKCCFFKALFSNYAFKNKLQY